MSEDLKRILLVEDDPDVAILTAMAIRDIGGMELVHCASGADALSKVVEIAPDLAVLDFSMPGMNGDELLMRLRERPETAELPVIFMTASVMPAHVARLRALGALDVIAKPFDPIELPDRLRKIWAKQKAL
jgi:CheY-like chemotaxis protein